MPSAWSAPELVLGALRTLLATRLGAGVTVKIGPVGNERLAVTPNGAVLALVAGTPDRTLAPAEIVDTTPPADPDESPIGSALLDYGSAKLQITGNLYAWSEKQGKTLRAEKLRAIEEAFDLVEGQPHEINLLLDDGLGTTANVVLEDIRNFDNPEGVEVAEWRAILIFEVRYPLRSSRELPFCKDIFVQTERGTYSVTHAIENRIMEG